MTEYFLLCIITLCSLYECYILTLEYRYDAEKDAKRQRRTRTTKKTTQMPSGESITEEQTEVVEHKGELNESQKA